MLQRKFSQNVTLFMRGIWPKRGIFLKVEKEQKVRFHTEIERKPNMIQRQFS